MAKVLLLSPLYLDTYGSFEKAAGRYFPLGLGYIAAYLEKYAGHEVKLFEPEAQKLTVSDIELIVKNFVPDIVGITCSTANFTRAIKLAKLCKNHSAAKVVLGGVHVSAIPEFVMSENADYVDCLVVGEGEQTMLELVDAYQKGQSIESIKGLVYKKQGKIVRTESRPFIQELDSIPFPARHLIPQNLFYPNMHNARYRNCQTILTSRGCPFNCSFCAARIVSGARYRTHSAAYVLDEMLMLKRDYNTKQLIITDDTFTVDKDRLEKICKGMIEKKFNLKWFCFAHINTVDQKLLKLMKDAGCYSIGFGIESSNQEILKRMGKLIKPERAKEVVNIANRVGLKTQAFYIIGSPEESKSQMVDTIKFSRRVDSTLAFYNMLVPFPGTKEFNYFFSATPLSSIDWEKFVAIGENCVLKNSGVSGKDIQAIISKANIIYYANPIRLLRLLFHIRTFYELGNYCLGAVALCKQINQWLRVKKNAVSK